MKAIIINNEIKFDKDALSLAEMGYQIGEEVECFDFHGAYFIKSKQDVMIDEDVAIYKGETFDVSMEEVEVVA